MCPDVNDGILLLFICTREGTLTPYLCDWRKLLSLEEA
jgi:hypothetical protein